jgi:hypothetical protein
MKGFGSLHGGAQKITLETLIKMGFKGSDLSVLADGPAVAGLDVNAVWGLSLKLNVYNGQSRVEISSIYVPGEAGPMKKMDRGEAKSKMPTGLEATLAQLRSAAPAPSTKAATPKLGF